jgi:hypothetical protein
MNQLKSIATDYGLDGRGSFPGMGKLSLFTIASRLALVPTQPPIQWVSGTISPEVKRPGRESDYSHPSSAEVKNGGVISPFSHISSWHSA